MRTALMRQLAGAGAVALLAVAGVATRDVPAGPWVVVVSLDTVRADVLGAYGGRATTPHLDALAARSARFDAHFAAAPTTLASHASLFTGTHPHTHGVPRNGFVVSGEARTLAEILGGAGWRTAGFAASAPLAAKTGISQGFDVWAEPEGPARPGADVVDDALGWVDAEDPGDGTPRLLFVHLYDAHAPYRAPAGYLERLGSLPPSTAGEPGSLVHIGAVRRLAAARDPALDAEGRALRHRYAAGVGFLDHQVGRLLGGLQRRGILDRALLAVTADHGEAYDEHGEIWGHGYTVFDETTRIPLIIAGPGVGTGEVDRLGSNIDVLPTILDLVGVPIPDGVEGTSFAPTLRGADQPRRTVVFSEATKPYDDPAAGWVNAPRRKSARTSTLRLVWDPATDERNLYRSDADPSELVDRWTSDRDRPEVRALDLGLAAWAADPRPLATVPLDDAATREALEALGYVDGAAP